MIKFENVIFDENYFSFLEYKDGRIWICFIEGTAKPAVLTMSKETAKFWMNFLVDTNPKFIKLNNVIINSEHLYYVQYFDGKCIAHLRNKYDVEVECSSEQFNVLTVKEN